MDKRETDASTAVREPAVHTEQRVALAYVDFARRRGWLIVLTTALALAGAYGVTRLVPKTYEATASLFVGSITASNQREANGVLYNGLVSENLARSYSFFAKSRSTLRAAEARAGAAIPRGDIDAAPVPDSQILEITGSASNSELAAKRANAVAATLVATISGQRTIPEARLRVVDGASPPSKAATPKLWLNLALGALGGLLLGYAFALIWDRIESSPRSIR